MITAEQKTRISQSHQNDRVEIVGVVLEAIYEAHFHWRAGLSVPEIVKDLRDKSHERHTAFLQAHKNRFRVEDELAAIQNSRRPNLKSMAEKEAEVEALRTVWADLKREYLDARRWEEFSRCLEAADESNSVEDISDLIRFVFITAAWSPEIEEIQVASETIQNILAE